MEEQQKKEVFKCSGDCLNCREEIMERQGQWRYCAAQRSYDTMRMMQDMQKSLAAMAGTVEELKGKIEAIQGNEATIYHPADNDKDEAETTAPAAPVAPIGPTIPNRQIAQ